MADGNLDRRTGKNPHGLYPKWNTIKPGSALHPRWILLSVVRRVEGMGLYGDSLYFHFLKWGNPVHRKVGIPAWKVWADNKFGAGWCVLVDRTDIWSSGFVSS